MFKTVQGREMRIAPFDPGMLHQQEANVFVKNLGGDVTNLSLYGLFKSMGEIFSSRLAQDSQGKSRGYGFIHFTTTVAAQRCITEMNGRPHHDLRLVVEPYKARDKAIQAGIFNNLYVKNLPPSVTSADSLDKLFASFGPRLSVGISQSELKGKIGYFGFVAFKDPADAARAASEMNQKVVEGVSLCVVKALTKEQRARDKRRTLVESREAKRKVTLYIKSVTGDPLSEELVRQQLQDLVRIKQISIPRRVVPSAAPSVGSASGSGSVPVPGAPAEVALPIGFVVLESPQDLQKVQQFTSI